jgi:diadenosine hexaphosphate hydrolase (ATP-forming)
MIEEVSAGGVAYRQGRSGQELLMIKDRYGRWTFPKGGVEPGETLEQTALREVREETSLTGPIIAKIGETKYQYQDYRGQAEKTVHYFLIQADPTAISPQWSEIRDARWFTIDEALISCGYDNMLPILNRSIALLP